MSRVVVAHPDRKAQRSLQRLVGATLCPIEVVADAEALAAAVDADTIAVVDVGLAQAHPALREKAARAWIAVPGEGLAAAEAGAVASLLESGWDHIVSHPMPVLAEELLATVQKLLRGDAFGLEKYMVWGAEVRSITLDNARERDDAVATLARDIIAAGLPDRIGSLVSVIADELIANAIYVAPVDDKGEHVRANDSRDSSRALAGKDAVTVRWSTDARYLAIEVRDQWGTLDGSTIAPRLATAGKQAAASDSGMGLALAYACCNQLVVGCCPGQLTEIIALIDVRYKPTELGRSASFHSFRGKAP